MRAGCRHTGELQEGEMGASSLEGALAAVTSPFCPFLSVKPLPRWLLERNQTFQNFVSGILWSRYVHDNSIQSWIDAQKKGAGLVSMSRVKGARFTGQKNIPSQWSPVLLSLVLLLLMDLRGRN